MIEHHGWQVEVVLLWGFFPGAVLRRTNLGVQGSLCLQHYNGDHMFLGGRGYSMVRGCFCWRAWTTEGSSPFFLKKMGKPGEGS